MRRLQFKFRKKLHNRLVSTTVVTNFFSRDSNVIFPQEIPQKTNFFSRKQRYIPSKNSQTGHRIKKKSNTNYVRNKIRFYKIVCNLPDETEYTNKMHMQKKRKKLYYTTDKRPNWPKIIAGMITKLETQTRIYNKFQSNCYSHPSKF